MKVTLESTSKLVQLRMGGLIAPARIWEGRTANDIRCHAYIVRIAVARAEDTTEFDRDLRECTAPSPEVEALPFRLIL